MLTVAATSHETRPSPTQELHLNTSLNHCQPGNAVLLEHEVEGLTLLLSRIQDTPYFQEAVPAQIADPRTLLKVCGESSENQDELTPN